MSPVTASNMIPTTLFPHMEEVSLCSQIFLDLATVARLMREMMYTSDPLTKDIEVTGRILAKLYAASSAGDTDFTADLVDVRPNGYAEVLDVGIIRARHRKSFNKEE
jgi:hypothetical protein